VTTPTAALTYTDEAANDLVQRVIAANLGQAGTSKPHAKL